MIKISNRSEIESTVSENQSIKWYDPVPSQEDEGVFFVGTIKPNTAKDFFTYPIRRIVIIDKQDAPKGSYKGIFWDQYLKFADQGEVSADSTENTEPETEETDAV